MSDPKSEPLKAPFPWFGGKSRAASLIWSRLGNVANYVEPFAGSLAVLLLRPHAPVIETVNDIDGYVANFWRALASKPDEVEHHADNPVNECDLHARHLWLLQHKEDLPLRLMADPDYCDPKVAGWWVWGVSAWIGSGWCSGKGPWRNVEGVFSRLPHLGDGGRGVNRQLPYLSSGGMGVNGDGTSPFFLLAERLRNVRVACGDWSRVCGQSVTHKLPGITGVVLDPPYAVSDRADCYNHESMTVAHDVREWAVAEGKNPKMRIALCGYDGEHAMPDDWECVSWKAKGGYAGQSKNHNNPNAKRERIWFSPHCLKPAPMLNHPGCPESSNAQGSLESCP